MGKGGQSLCEGRGGSRCFLSFLLLWSLQDMAIARSCLTLWVYRILVAHAC